VWLALLFDVRYGFIYVKVRVSRLGIHALVRPFLIHVHQSQRINVRDRPKRFTEHAAIRKQHQNQMTINL
jgi:hypothetical protein